MLTGMRSACGVALVIASFVGATAGVGACGSGAKSPEAPGADASGVTPSQGEAPGGRTPGTPACAAAGGDARVAEPTLVRKLADDGREGWLASPAIADLDGDGRPEVVVARGGRVFAFGHDGASRFAFDTTRDRIWASPVVADFGATGKPRIAVAARGSVYVIDAAGALSQGFPVETASETRSLAAGDPDGDGRLDVIAGVRSGNDVAFAFRGDGSAVPGFPTASSGASGCTRDTCIFAGLYDQNVAVGDLDGDGLDDLVLPHDNAYASFFHGSGAAFDADPMFRERPKTPGVRYLHRLADAQQGYANDESSANQAHFTNTAPAIADIDGDGRMDIVMLGSVQNASQTDRRRGVALWVVGSNAARRGPWVEPLHVPDYVMGLADGFADMLDGDAIAGAANLVGATNQTTVADIAPEHAGLEMIFAGFDGRIHAVGADRTELWSTPYATDGRALTGGVLAVDLSSDGVPEIVFATYSPDAGQGALFVLDAKGTLLHRVPLPKRGAMAVPTVGDADGDGTLDIVVSLKDAEPKGESVLVFRVEGARPNCMPWPTGRANLLRNGWIP